MSTLPAFWRLVWAEFWLRYAPHGTPERTHYLRMRAASCRALGIEVLP